MMIKWAHVFASGFPGTKVRDQSWKSSIMDSGSFGGSGGGADSLRQWAGYDGSQTRKFTLQCLKS